MTHRSVFAFPRTGRNGKFNVAQKAAPEGINVEPGLCGECLHVAVTEAAEYGTLA